MRAAFALLLVTFAAHAADDAPLNPHPKGPTAILSLGTPTPFNGILIADTEHARREWNNEKTAGELAKLQESQGAKFLSVPVLIAVVAGSIAVGMGVGIGVSLAIQRPAPLP